MACGPFFVLVRHGIEKGRLEFISAPTTLNYGRIAVE